MTVTKLTDKQKKFVDEYLIDLNATQAAIRAGYSAKTAFTIGNENLRKPYIQACIQKRQSKLQESTEITQERVLMELASIAFVNGTDFAKLVNKPIKDNEGYNVLNSDGSVKMYADVDFKDTDSLSEDKKKAIASIELGKYGICVKSYDKIKALELIGKHIGMFKDADKPNGDENATGIVMLPPIDGDDDG